MTTNKLDDETDDSLHGLCMYLEFRERTVRREREMRDSQCEKKDLQEYLFLELWREADKI